MKSSRFNFKRCALLFTAALFLASSFILTSCKQDDDDDSVNNGSTIALASDSPLIGSWKSTSELFTIVVINSVSGFNNGYYSGSTLINTYAGGQVHVRFTNTEKTAGYIYILYTRSMNADYTYSETAPDVGKWYAISFKNLTSTSLSLSGAYKAGGSTSKTNMSEAISEFTIENGYFSMYSECTKQ